MMQEQTMMQVLKRHPNGIPRQQLKSFEAKHTDLQKTYNEIKSADDIAMHNQVAFQSNMDIPMVSHNNQIARQIASSIEFEENAADHAEDKSKMDISDIKDMKLASEKYFIAKFKNDIFTHVDSHVRASDCNIPKMAEYIGKMSDHVFSMELDNFEKKMSRPTPWNQLILDSRKRENITKYVESKIGKYRTGY